MSANSSLVDPSQLPSNSSLLFLDCFIFKSMSILTAFSITNILLMLPLSTLVLYLGYQRWRKQRSISTSAAATTNHSDIFTYQMGAVEMIGVLGCLLLCVGVNIELQHMVIFGLYLFFSTWCVKTHFHTLTCVEHYLAVVHPVTYLGLKNKRRITIRNISIGCVWLMSFLGGGLMFHIYISLSLIIYSSLVVCALIVICFCCISVLCALRRPSPGEVVRNRERVDQKKRRAFNTVVTIMGALWLYLGGMLVCVALVESNMLSDGNECVVLSSTVWFSLPNSLVLPLQYLQRAGKLPGCKH